MMPFKILKMLEMLGVGEVVETKTTHADSEDGRRRHLFP